MQYIQYFFLSAAFASAMLFVSCDKKTPVGPDKPDTTTTKTSWTCVIPEGTEPDYARAIGCKGDFTALSSEPMDASIPGSTSGKTVIDLADSGRLYFQNSKKFQIHYNFTSTHLSGNGKPIITTLSIFNTTEYYSPDRRFILGAITRYDGPGVWTYEIAPYDNASAAMITMAYQKIADSCFFGDTLYFHPTSQTIEKLAKTLPSSIKIITTDEIYKDVDYQPLNLATGMGRLTFVTAQELDTHYVSYRDIVVLDEVPNDISVAAGIITQEFQTPLSHVNVLSSNRGTPNMGLKGAFTDTALRKLENKWVQLIVGSSEYSVTEVTQAQADAWWDAHKPATVQIPNLDTTVKELRDAEKVLDIAGLGLGPALKAALPAFGGKASHFCAFPHMDTSKVPIPKAFVIPVYFYWQFMKQNGFDKKMAEMLEDSVFKGDPAIRKARLAQFQDSIMVAPVDTTFLNMLMTKLKTDYPTIEHMRFRSSTNGEDLDGFTGAGLYTSTSGDPNKINSIRNAVRTVWASVWRFKAFEERSYRNIPHLAIGMALLVHHSAPDEEAQGVAITANPYDASGMEPGFYINAQAGSSSVVLPDPRITTDEIIYYFDMPGQPIVYMAHSNLIPDTAHVLTNKQIHTLGIALEEIHKFFQPLYGSDPNKFYGMDTEFKFDHPAGDSTAASVLYMKQCRPYAGMGK
jgi:hypothetical protein